jgi:hypothetical protein
MHLSTTGCQTMTRCQTMTHCRAPNAIRSRPLPGHYSRRFLTLLKDAMMAAAGDSALIEGHLYTFRFISMVCMIIRRPTQCAVRLSHWCPLTRSQKSKVFERAETWQLLLALSCDGGVSGCIPLPVCRGARGVLSPCTNRGVCTAKPDILDT